MFEKEEKHETYGIVSVSRYTGFSTFFGSDISHSGGISLKIRTAVKERSLHKDWIHSDDNVVEISMSNNQFVEMITSAMNTEGVPCTFRVKNGKYVEQIDHIQNKEEVYNEELAETNEGIETRLKELMSYVQEIKASKKVKDSLTRRVGVILSNLSSNFRFIKDSFKKETEKMVVEAKNSINNYVDHKIYSTGLTQLKKELKDVQIEYRKEKSGE